MTKICKKIDEKLGYINTNQKKVKVAILISKKTSDKGILPERKETFH